jgi:transcriptional regulator with XRE-family HTH domain
MVKEFLLKKLTSENINSAAMSQKIGISPPSLSLILSGKRFPSGETLIKIIKCYPDIVDTLLND